MKRLKRLMAFLTIQMGWTGFLYADPSISAISGVFLDNGIVQIRGAGFADKSPAAPYLWADFENGVNPNPISVKKSWGQIQSMSHSSEGFRGSKGMKASNDSGYWTMRVDYNAWTRDGQRFYIHRRQKMNFTIASQSQNWKTWRLWPAQNGYPNIYAATNNGRVFVEKVGANSGFYGTFNSQTTNWVSEEIIGKASTINAHNGSIAIRYDGRQVASGAVMTRSSSAPSLMEWNFVVHAVQANKGSWSPSWSSNNRVWVDDVYVDTTWARVILGNAPTYASVNQFQHQIPTAWSDGLITVQANTDMFPSGSRVYLYVIDKNGAVNPNGYPITVGSGSAPTAGVNQMPTVNAGANFFVGIRGRCTLNGLVSDDGMPAPSRLSSTWSKVSGPGTVTFANPSAANTTATFGAVGAYVLRLAASDGILSSQSQVTVTVDASSNSNSYGNQAPVVDAGGNQTVAIAGGALLQPVVTDDGASANSTVSTVWSKVSGPGNVVFENPRALRTTVAFTDLGDYVLRLTAKDGTYTASDDVTVRVLEAIPQTQLLRFKNIFNPANNETITIPFNLDRDGTATVKIFDRMGGQVREISQMATIGTNSIDWNGTNDSGSTVASGVYVVAVKVDQVNLPVQKVVVIK